MQTSDFGAFDAGVSARINEIIDETKDYGPSFMATGLFQKEGNPDSMKFNTKGVVGLSYLEPFDEDDGIKEDRTYDSYGTSYVYKQYGKIVSISKALMNTRSSELEAKLGEVKQAMISAQSTLDKHAWMVLVDGFSTTNSDASFPTHRLDDAVSFFSTAHPSKVSGVSNRSNRVASNAVLSETNLFTAKKQVIEQLNGRGLPINWSGSFVLVLPPALEKLGFEILKSNLRSDSANNDVNYFSGIGMDMAVVNYIGAANGGSDTAWYLFAKSAPTPAMRYISWSEPSIEKEVDFNTKKIRVSVDAAYAFGYSCFEYAVGSDGSGS